MEFLVWIESDKDIIVYLKNKLIAYDYLNTFPVTFIEKNENYFIVYKCNIAFLNNIQPFEILRNNHRANINKKMTHEININDI